MVDLVWMFYFLSYVSLFLRLFRFLLLLCYVWATYINSVCCAVLLCFCVHKRFVSITFTQTSELRCDVCVCACDILNVFLRILNRSSALFEWKLKLVHTYPNLKCTHFKLLVLNFLQLFSFNLLWIWYFPSILAILVAFQSQCTQVFIQLFRDIENPLNKVNQSFRFFKPYAFKLQYGISWMLQWIVWRFALSNLCHRFGFIHTYHATAKFSWGHCRCTCVQNKKWVFFLPQYCKWIHCDSSV